MTSLAKAYYPQAFEKQIAEQWENSGAFRADANSEKPAFTISMPPPNATGQLHVGHAVMLVLEDIFSPASGNMMSARSSASGGGP